MFPERPEIPPDFLDTSYFPQEPSWWPVAVAVLVAAAILYFTARSRRHYRGLPVLPLVRRGAFQPLSVIIPARNEADVIERCVRSFPPEVEVLVVDDQSTDATSRRAAQAGARVISAGERPPGWLGKTNACWTGARSTSSRWLLFVDADTWYLPGFIPSLLHYAQEEKLDAATVFPKQLCLTWAERMLMPYAFGLYFAGVNRHAVNEPRASEALANGQCLLVRRDAYEFLRGHKAVAERLTEDVALAQLMKKHQMRLRVLRSETLARVRMYDGFPAIWRGFQRNAFRFFLSDRSTGSLVFLASILMTSWLPVVVWLALEGWWLVLVAFLFVPTLAWYRWYGSLSRAWRAPLAIYLFQAIILTATVRSLLGLKTIWKGRPV
jgi:glycosyltransferase involved in cell wall biosynthesis